MKNGLKEIGFAAFLLLLAVLLVLSRFSGRSASGR